MAKKLSRATAAKRSSGDVQKSRRGKVRRTKKDLAYSFGGLTRISFDSIAEFSRALVGKERRVRTHSTPLLGQYGTIGCSTICGTSPEVGSVDGCCK